jgi:toxin YoeB
MKVVFTESGWQDYLWFQEHNRPLLKRINDLIKDAQRSPFRGLGKPEPLKGELSGYWSRRINAEHRLVYGVSETALTIIYRLSAPLYEITTKPLRRFPSEIKGYCPRRGPQGQQLLEKEQWVRDIRVL